VSDTTVLIVGGGFAGVACAQQLAKRDVDVVLLDQNNYHQFQPLLYQVATAQMAAYDIAAAAWIFHRDKTVDVRRTAAVSIDRGALGHRTECHDLC
jgi:NADH dehydrogenase